MNVSQYTYNHPKLGLVTGAIRTPSVIQFRNVPYARIPARFRQSEVVDTLFPPSETVP